MANSPVHKKTKKSRLPRTLDAEAAESLLDLEKQRLLSKSSLETRKLVAAQKSGQVNRVTVLIVGAGPSGAIMANIFGQYLPAGSSVLVLEANSQGMGTFDTFGDTFHVNSAEYYGDEYNQGNTLRYLFTFPGTPIQPKDLNFENLKYVSSAVFGQLTVATHWAAGHPILFKQEVGPLCPVPSSSPGVCEVVTTAGLRIVPDVLVIATGFGAPRTDSFVEAELENAKADPTYTRLAETIDTYLVSCNPKNSSEKKSNQSSEKNHNLTYVVVGSGDGGRAAVTFALMKEGIGRIVWLGQDALTASQYVDQIPVFKRDRYISLGDFFPGSTNPQSQVIEPASEKYLGAKKISVNGRDQVEVLYGSEGGRVRTVVVDKLILAIGYIDGLSRFLEGFTQPDCQNNWQDFMVAPDNFSTEVCPKGPQVAGKKLGSLPIYAVGTVGGVGHLPINIPKEGPYKGGPVDILGALAAAAAKKIAEEIPGDPNISLSLQTPTHWVRNTASIPLILSSGSTQSSQASTAHLRLKVELDRALKQVLFPERKEIRISFSKKGELGISNSDGLGLSIQATQAAAQLLLKNPDVIEAVRSLTLLSQRDLVVSFSIRNDGRVRGETIEVS